MTFIVAGIICMLAGIVLMIMSNMLGLVLLLAGLVIVVLRYVMMMRGSNLNPDQGTINGLGGQGKQQSEAVPLNQSGSGEQPANIWDQVEGK